MDKVTKYGPAGVLTPNPRATGSSIKRIRLHNSVEDCSDQVNLLPSPTSRRSRSLERSRGSTPRSSQRTSSGVKTPSKISLEEDEDEPLKKSKLQRSQSTIPLAGDFLDFCAEVHTPTKKDIEKSSKKSRSVSADSANRKEEGSKGISAALQSPIKKQLIVSRPVRSKSEHSGVLREKYANPIVLTYKWNNGSPDTSESPPSPAPDSPIDSNHVYVNPLCYYPDDRDTIPLLDEPGSSWQHEQVRNRFCNRQYPLQKDSDDDSSENSSRSDYAEKNNTDSGEPDYSQDDPSKELNVKLDGISIESTAQQASEESPAHEEPRAVPREPPRRRRNSRLALSWYSDLDVIPEEEIVSNGPHVLGFDRLRFELLNFHVLYSPAATPGPVIGNLPDSFFRRPLQDRYLERYPPRSLSESNLYMWRMNPLENSERKVIIEFCHLLEKSKQLFNGLRDLPQYGHKQWHSYFGRTFDVYTKLWKYQQQHRALLDNNYGLKRWQIGEIASKIGQLYYHFYLRTSETAYLNEAFSFYYAIRGRSYYTKACKEDKCELIVKKLRYYARFIVVCLLLKKLKLVRELIKELDRQIIEYGNTYDPEDQIEWSVVMNEIKAFILSEPVVTVIHPDSYPMILSHRLSPLTTPPVERTPQMVLSLQEVLIVGSCSRQVKFSELTIDMYRMLQTMEREPTGDIQHMYDDSPRQRFIPPPSAASKAFNMENGPRCENPHKYLMFKPSPVQILVYLSSGCYDLPHNGVLLLYLSADGQVVQSKHPEDGAYDIGGLITTSKNDIYKESNSKDSKNSTSKYNDPCTLHPGDLFPFTRRPLFVIVDSDNSHVFQSIPRYFGQPLVVLMSPLEIPSSLQVAADNRHQGSLFTLFLHSPLGALCQICDVNTISLIQWDRAQGYVDAFMAEASQLVTRSRIDPMYIAFIGDEFLRVLTLRFIFCEVTLRLHRAFRMRAHFTRSSPPIPDELLDHPSLTHILLDLVAHLQVRGNFHDRPGSGGPSRE